MYHNFLLDDMKHQYCVDLSYARLFPLNFQIVVIYARPGSKVLKKDSYDTEKSFKVIKSKFEKSENPVIVVDLNSRSVENSFVETLISSKRLL